MNKRIIKSNDEGGGGAASFNTVLWTGDGTNNRSIGGVGFQPDFVWIKRRDSSDNWHALQDVVRGANHMLFSNATNGELINQGSGHVNSFEVDGFNIDVAAGSNVNGLNATYVAWCWKAGGAAVTNTDGTITSQVSANTEAGFSVVSYTGQGSAGSVGHGLDSAPNVVILKKRSAAQNWFVWHNDGTTLRRFEGLNTTNAAVTSGLTTTLGNESITFNNAGDFLANSSQYIAYCFAEVAGFSKFGSYTGTGNTSGNVVVTVFEPAFVMVKRTDAPGGSWLMVDNKRVAAGNEKHELFANTSTAESGTGYDVAFLENGFQMQTTTSNANASGGTYIYMAFANQF